MAHDGFLGGFHDLPWPLAKNAAISTTRGGAPVDARQSQEQMDAGAGAGWEQDAAMGSFVLSRSPSPWSLVAAVGRGGAAVEAALMEQMASRLGVGVPSPTSSRYASCYSSPVGSQSKAAAEPFGAPLLGEDADRAARLSRVANSQSILGEPALAQAPGGAQQQGSDGSNSCGPSRKRKAPGIMSKAKFREPDTKGKKCKLSTDAGDDEERKPAAGEARCGNGEGKEVAVELHKDYIHVRARRGQATDSHSLAERVRREKISERMKLLQDLVPGCSKVTGKAVMLDEIINYVQSLQRQVEFLSLKLSTVNPRLEIDVDSFIPKDVNQQCTLAASSLPPSPPPVYMLEGSSPGLCYASSQGAAASSAVTSVKSFVTPSTFVNHDIPDHSLNGFQNANSQMGSLWEEDDLQSLVLMGFRGNT